MQFDMQSKLDEYLRLLEQIKQRTTDERTAVSLLQEVSKDRRSLQIQGERTEKDNRPATAKQKDYLRKLGIKFPENLTKAEASALIDEGLAKNGE